MQTILIANPKGGSGKSTLSTNIAGYLASTGKQVSLLDLDRQQSASLWLAQRDSSLPIIWPLKEKNRDADESDVLVIDSPAGLHGKNLEQLLKTVHKIVVPIAPSLFDIHASHDFLQELSQQKVARKGRVDIAVIGMRMAARTRAALTLEQFLLQLHLPVIAYLREAQVYVNAAFEGKSIFDLPPHLAAQDVAAWADLVEWLEA
jgi:chromosome partitioning protein